jgi:hypothetical protein
VCLQPKEEDDKKHGSAHTQGFYKPVHLCFAVCGAVFSALPAEVHATHGAKAGQHARPTCAVHAQLHKQSHKQQRPQSHIPARLGTFKRPTSCKPQEWRCCRFCCRRQTHK